MGGDTVGQLGGIGDLGQGGQRFRRDLLVQFNIIVELGRHGAHQRFHFGIVARVLVDHAAFGFVIIVTRAIAGNFDAYTALDQDFHRPVGQFQQLQDRGDHTGGMDRIRCRLVVGRTLLGRQKDLLVRLHHLFQRPDGFLAADKERHDHVRKYDNVPEGEKRKCLGIGHYNSCAPFASGAA